MNLKERIYESQKEDNKEETVFVVNDVNGEFVGVYDIKDDDEKDKKEYEIMCNYIDYECCKDTKAVEEKLEAQKNDVEDIINDIF